MCEKKRYCAREIDPCIQAEVKLINNKLKDMSTIGKTILSCCGHGKYHKTILIYLQVTDGLKVYPLVFDNISHVILSRERKRTYYRKDSEGYYYIPQVEFFYEGKGSKLGFYHLLDNIENEIFEYRSAEA